MLGTLKSESFANEAAQGTISGNGSASSGTANASFVYQASNQTYTMTVGANAQSFGPSAIDQTQSNASETVYVVKSGNTTDSLTLTKPGTSGRFTYEYVGSAFWQSTTLNGNSGSGFLYAVTYGEPTPATAVPKSGQGQYGIDLIGAAGSGATVTGYTGQGTLQVDFVSGAIGLGGTVSLNGAGDGGFAGAAKLASSGSFSGSIALDAFGSGQINGALYGPNAQEVGGSYYTTIGANTVSDGVILGRSETTTANNSFASLTSPQFFNADRVRIQGTGTTGLGTLQLSDIPAGSEPAYSLFTPDYNVAPMPSSVPTASANISLGTSALIASSGTGLDIFDPDGGAYSTQYVRAGVWYDKTGSTPLYDLFTFGFNTPGSAVPVSGFAGYTVNLDGILVNPNTPKTTEISGQGIFGVEFSTGKITASGTIDNGPPTSSPALASFSASGTLASGGSNFTGTLSATAASTAYNGNLQGALYGPTANEVGAVFNAKGGDGTSISGLFTGAQNASIADPLVTLSTLAGKTQFSTLGSIYENILGYSPTTFTNAFTSGSTITYDPSAQTYTITSPGSGDSPSATLSPSNADPANSNATFAAYSGPNLTAHVLKSGANNPAIQLSYVSFADVAEPGKNSGASAPYTAYNYLVFGLQTNASAMPTSGTASYSGVVYGRGGYSGGSGSDFNLNGTGQLAVNFGTATATTTLTLNAAPLNGGASSSLGTLVYGPNGGPNIQGSTFSGISSTLQGQGLLKGAFFGPSANEVGATFYISGLGSGQPSFAGVLVGKKN